MLKLKALVTVLCSSQSDRCNGLSGARDVGGHSVSSRGRFAGRADLRALDALAREHAFFFQGRDYRRQLPTLYRARQYRFCLIHQTFGGGDVGSSGNGTCSAPSVRVARFPD